jgi:hypothetical protein
MNRVKKGANCTNEERHYTLLAQKSAAQRLYGLVCSLAGRITLLDTFDRLRPFGAGP